MAGPLIFDTIRLQISTPGFDWQTVVVQAMLVDAQTWTPAAGDQFVTTILTAGAVEAASSGDRQTLTTPVAAIVSHKANWSSDPISYPNVTLGTPFDTLVIFAFVTNDADSYLIACFDLGAQTGDGNPISLTAPSGYLDW